ncbi:MAG: folylpolyglutamate synthase/dihydrofolate synthase family protein [Clostridium sp.]|uniref:bifunctional folylpolyglutamate synthase/dihydrofolate synthase n=1 Tax=Clostridium sp. TaxID=1506 RepID=UPI002A90F7C2|nr:folylpolyglutamate synthase/dihydrofolate synthase family protein [Clostridium sp.]MDY6226427.1 folylpolyglutamate synthase/dihydrofolate synthase family protein [Clostridium sp.]
MKDIDTLKYLEELRVLGSNYGLQRTERLLELLGNPHKKLKLIHIAGTNGKGSTSAILGKVLIEHGYKIGFFNSPHLEEIEETIRINDNNIKEEDFVKLINEIKPFVNQVVKEGFNHPTEFEVLTCIMFLYLYRQKVDFGIIEVGLGGRLDSTNVLTPILSIITSISMDHMNILGNTIEEISKEKAGIIKRGVPIVTCIQRDEVIRVITEKSIKENSNLIIVNPNNYKILEFNKDININQKILVNINGKEEILNLSLLGEHQILNLSLAIEALKELDNLKYINLDINKLILATKMVKWKGRLEILNEKPYIVVDGAHNVDGVKYLKKNIEAYFKYNNLYLILGILGDKEVEKMLKIIAPMAKEVYTVTSNSNRATNSEDLKKEVFKYNKNCLSFEDYIKAANYAINRANEDDIILASGSLYMIGKMREIIKGIISNNN